MVGASTTVRRVPMFQLLPVAGEDLEEAGRGISNSHCTGKNGRCKFRHSRRCTVT